MKAWKVRELLQALVDMTTQKPESLDIDVVVRVDDGDESFMIGSLTAASLDEGCTDTEVLLLDGHVRPDRAGAQDRTQRGPKMGNCACGHFSSRLTASGQCMACAERRCE